MSLIQRTPPLHKPSSWSMCEVEGSWPSDCQGTLLRNGPALFERNGHRRNHLFDGDGYVQTWSFQDGVVRHRGAWVQTKKFKEEQAAGRFLYPGFADGGAGDRMVRCPDDLNTANTNVMAWNGRLLALWEAGSAYELDAQSLDTLGVKTWSSETQAAPFGAHPKTDADGLLWNIGIANNQLLIYVINPDGSLARVRAHAVRPCALVHDFFLTERFLGVWLAPLQLDHGALQAHGNLLSAMRWREQEGSHLLMIDRNSLDLVKTFELEAELIFHFANAWEEDGHLHLSYIRNTFGQLHAGLALTPNQSFNVGDQVGHGHASFRRICLTTGAAIADWQGSEQVDFPQIDERLRGTASPRVFSLLATSAATPSTFNGLMSQDVDLGHRQLWEGDGALALEEHVFVPKCNEDLQAGGWLIGSGYNTSRCQSFCSVFDANQLAKGPIAIAYLDAPAPLSFHGQFLAST